VRKIFAFRAQTLAEIFGRDPREPQLTISVE